MVALTEKSPNNKKRKSITPGAGPPTPKNAKFGKNQKSPAATTPKQPPPTPKGKSPKQNGGGKQKLKPFAGTSKDEEDSEDEGDVKVATKKETPLKKKGDFHQIQEKLAKGDKVGALGEINAKIAEIEARQVKSKTAKRKVSLLQRLKHTAEGKAPISKAVAPKAGKKGQQKQQQVEEDSDEDEEGSEEEGDSDEEEVDGAEESAEEESDEEASGSGEDESGAEEEEEDEKDEEESAPKAKKAKTEAKTKHDKPEFPPISEQTSIFINQLAKSTTEAQLRQFFNKCGDIKSLQLPLYQENGEARGFAFIEFKSEESVKKALPLNGSVLNEREITLRRFISRDKVDKLDIFVNNIDYDATDEQIKELFGKCGKMQYVKRVINPQTQKPKGFAFIRFEEASSAKKALGLNGTDLNERELSVTRAESQQKGTPNNKNKPFFKPGQKRNFGGKPQQFGGKPQQFGGKQQHFGGKPQQFGRKPK